MIDRIEAGNEGRVRARPSTTKNATAQPRLRVTKTLEPKQPGAIKLARKYGDALLCVRYRIDALGQNRYTTVELIVDETPVCHRLPRLVGVDIKLSESLLRSSACAAGARWDPQTRLWQMPLGVAKALGLQGRIEKR